MRRLILFMLLVLVLAPAVVFAQGTAAWEVVVYVESGDENARSGEFVVLTPNGVVASYEVPAALYANAPNGYQSVAVSPDRQYAALGTIHSGDQPVPPVAIMNLTTGTCCTFVTAPVADVDNYALVGFSPDSSQLAVSYVGFDNRETFDISSGMMVVNPATAQMTAAITLDEIEFMVDLPDFTAFAMPGAWTGAGISFVPSCWACDGIFEDFLYIWNPTTNQVAQSAGEYFSIFGDTLPATGELLYTTQNMSFPVSNQPGYFLPENVVEYYAQGVPIPQADRQGTATEAPVVYFDPDNLDLGWARWILDGNGLVIPASETSPQGTIVLRDRSEFTVPYDLNDTFLTGTPDGFLTQNSAFEVLYYQYAEPDWNVITLEALDGPARVAQATPLGASVTQPFSVVESGAQVPGGEPPLAPQQQSQPVITACPGFMESRLSPGGFGTVTPGSANRLRAQPSTSATIIGEIPGSSAFIVLSGPVCDPEGGIAWWEVDYNGLVGWTAEGQGDTYFVQPAGL